MKAHIFPRSYDLSELYTLKALLPEEQDVEIPVLKYHIADFASAEFDGEAVFEVEVACNDALDPDLVTIRPVSKNIDFKVEGKKIIFEMKKPGNIKVDIEGLHPLNVFMSTMEKTEDIPNPDDPDVIYLKGGQIYEKDVLELTGNQTLYLEAGAVFYGVVHGMGDNIRIKGRGMIDKGIHTRDAIQLEMCTNSVIEDIIILNLKRWHVVLGGCDGIVCRNIKELGGFSKGTDGIDVCGSKNVLIENCYIKCNDDCVVLKSFVPYNVSKTNDWRYNIENVTTRGCSFETMANGAIMEIGHELNTDYVRNIVFEDCDVIHVGGHGTVFSIQNTDKAVVSDVLYENIRIEHCFEKVINLRVMDSQYSANNRIKYYERFPEKVKLARPCEKGQVRNIKLKNIHWTTVPYNLGYSISLIGGYDEEHTVEDVTIEDFYIDGKKVTDIKDINIFTRYAKNISLK